jgi:hypothetical protein
MSLDDFETETHHFSSTVSVALSHRRRNACLLSSQADATGLMSWRAGTLLSAYLVAHDALLLKGKRIVELGCGSALLSCVAVACGCAEAVATDCSDEVLALAFRNLSQNSSVKGPECGGSSSFRTAKLVWGEQGSALGVFDIALAAEVFYHHRGGKEGNSIEDQARALFSTALSSLLPACTCSASAGGCSAGGCSAGLLLLTYTPRYPGMARALRAAAASLGIYLQTLDRRAALTPSLQETNYFCDTRLLCASACNAALDAHVRTLGSPPQAPREEDSDWEDEDCKEWVVRESQTPMGVSDCSLFS